MGLVKIITEVGEKIKNAEISWNYSGLSLGILQA
jgi:hypothetical protein